MDDCDSKLDLIEELGIKSRSTVATSGEDDGTLVSSCFEITCHQKLNRAKSIEEFSAVTLAITQALGASDYSLTRMASKDPSTAMVLGTTPIAMTDHYKHKNVWMHDLMLQYAADPKNTKPMYQSTIDDYIERASFSSETIRSNRETRRFIKGFGYHDYYDIPIKAVNGNGNVLMAITAKNTELADFQYMIEKSKYMFQILGRTVDYLGTKNFPKIFLDGSESRKIEIKPRPLRILTALAKDDLSLSEIAVKYHMSLSAANQQVAAAKKALDAKTVGHAIYLALKNGIID